MVISGVCSCDEGRGESFREGRYSRDNARRTRLSHERQIPGPYSKYARGDCSSSRPSICAHV